MSRAVHRIPLSDFSGGLNTRDSVNVLDLRETPEATNWTLDERRALKNRKGCINNGALPSTGAAYLFHSAALDLILCHQNGNLYTSPDDVLSWTSRGAIETNPTAFIDFPGNPPKVVLVNTSNGVYTYVPGTLTNVSATVKGSAIALWQNKAWVLGYPTSDANGNPTRLFWCNAGDPAAGWGTNFNDLREKDAETGTALGLIGGALIAFKKRSAYRVNNAATGAYTMIDASNGCVNARAAVSARGRLYTWGAENLYEWDGISAAVAVADRVASLFELESTNADASTYVSGGRLKDRIYFAHPANSLSTAADRILEYDPAGGWVMRHQLASTSQDQINSFMQWRDTLLYAALQDGADLFLMFAATAGRDDSTVYTATYRTPWIQPDDGKKCGLERLTVQALIDDAAPSTTLKIRVYVDFDRSSYTEFDISSEVRGGDSADDQEVAEIRAVAHGRAFAFDIIAGTAAGEVAVRSLTLEARPWER